MHWQLLIPALILGLVSSLHCVGMCGPIAFALPVRFLSSGRRIGFVFLYNLGRITSYTALGVVFGFAGRQIFLGGFQQVFSIIMGIVILLVVVQSIVGKRLLHIKAMDKAYLKVQVTMGRFLGKKQLYAAYLVGIANGFLPCGMVYLAITGSLAAGSVQNGALFMVFFGLGTWPAMLALSFFSVVINISARNTIKKITPYFALLVAVLLILRGMNLNIPYISPYLVNTGAAISCH